MKFMWLCVLCVLSVLTTIRGITVTNYDRPISSSVSDQEADIKIEYVKENKNDTNTMQDFGQIIERQRRLIPYLTYYKVHNNPSLQYTTIRQPQKINQPNYHSTHYNYVPVPYITKNIRPSYQISNVVPIKYTSIDHNQQTYQPHQAQIIKYTPFSESNKLPGGFTPMVNKIPYDEEDNTAQQPVNTVQNFIVYDKNVQYKQLRPPSTTTKIPEYNDALPLEFYTHKYNQQVLQRPTQYEHFFKSNSEKYTPVLTNTIPIRNKIPESQKYLQPTSIDVTKTIIHTYSPENIDITDEPYNTIKSEQIQIQAPINEVNEIRHPVVQQYNTNQKYKEYLSEKPIYVEPTHYETNTNSNSLQEILKSLQQSNTLPQTFTTNNIDNSIKTLVNILNILKQKQSKFQQDNSVQIYNSNPFKEDDPHIPLKGNIIKINNKVPSSHVPDNYIYTPNHINSGTTTQIFPEPTSEGGTPGKPGIDYPIFAEIPQTNFDCKTQRYKGFFGDPDTQCQVWHYCDLNGGQASFLCPNGTIFSQVALTCDWWHNVKCSSTPQLYVLNERLYKYILPFTPKFPEDYSGPLVDKYLAIKFQEMEEKMKQIKKGKGNNTDTQNDTENYQDKSSETDASLDEKRNNEKPTSE